jgi:hypothetical protein
VSRPWRLRPLPAGHVEHLIVWPNIIFTAPTRSVFSSLKGAAGDRLQRAAAARDTRAGSGDVLNKIAAELTTTVNPAFDALLKPALKEALHHQASMS